LSDADKLDAMGALGVYRTAMYSAEHGRPVNEFVVHFHEKLLKLRSRMFTPEARRMAESRHRFMFDFLAQLDRELKLET
ncbi:phosphohydrolase, partial [Candidatus Bathyarchaeota archaeon]